MEIIFSFFLMVSSALGITEDTKEVQQHKKQPITAYYSPNTEPEGPEGNTSSHGGD